VSGIGQALQAFFVEGVEHADQAVPLLIRGAVVSRGRTHLEDQLGR